MSILRAPTNAEQEGLLSSAFHHDGAAQSLLDAKLPQHAFPNALFYALYKVICNEQARHQANRLSALQVRELAVPVITQLTQNSEEWAIAFWSQIVDLIPTREDVHPLIARFNAWGRYIAVQLRVPEVSDELAKLQRGELGLGPASRLLGDFQQEINALSVMSGYGVTPDDFAKMAMEVGRVDGIHLSTGFSRWDMLLGRGGRAGAPIGSVNTFSGATGAGKTTMLCGMLKQICFANLVPTCYINYEVTPREYTAFLFAMIMGQNPYHRDSYIRQHAAAMGGKEKVIEHWDEMGREFGRVIGNFVRDDKFHLVNNAGYNIDEVLSIIKVKAGMGFKVFFLDTVNRIESSRRYSQQNAEIQNVMGHIEKVAHDLDVQIWLGAQENREKRLRKDPRPVLGDIAGSSSIEQYSYSVSQLFRSDLDGDGNVNYVEIYVNKSRGRGKQRDNKCLAKYSPQHMCYVPHELITGNVSNELGGLQSVLPPLGSSFADSSTPAGPI